MVLVRVESYSAGRRRRQAPCLAAQSISTRFEREVSARRRRQRRTQTVSHDSAPRTHVVTALRAGAPRTFRAAAAPRAPPPRRRPRERARALRRAPGAGPAATPEAPPPRLGRASVARGRSKPLAGKVGPLHGASAAPEQELRPRGRSARPTAALRSEQRCREPVQGPEPAKGCFASVFTQLLASACESQHTAAGGRARRSPLCWLAAKSDPKNDLPTSTL